MKIINIMETKETLNKKLEHYKELLNFLKNNPDECELEELEEIERPKRVLNYESTSLGFLQYVDKLEAYANKLEEKINYTRCCKSDSELLRVEKEPTTWDAFLAGYKKRAEMSGLKYDEVSELHAKTLYKCWKSFDLNP